MRFLPENISPKYNNENEVWQTVKKAFYSEEGTAYHGYRIKRFSGKEYIYAADIVILSRRLGAIIIECKGCEIKQIDRVRNTLWEMQDFYAETIRPIDQVEAQKDALWDQMRKRGLNPKIIKYRTVVALPFITRVQWQEKGFSEDSINENIAFQEELSPTAFLSWLEKRQLGDPQPALKDVEWREICKAFEFPDDLPTAATVMMTSGINLAQPLPTRSPSKLTLWEYEGRPPEAEELQEFIPSLGEASKRDYWYLVATSGLAHQRRTLAPEIQVVERLSRASRASGVKMQFRPALVHLMKVQKGIEPATKFDEVTAFKRVIGVMEQEPTRAEQLKHDRYSWLEALRAVEERGWRVKEDQIELIQHFSHPKVAQLLGELQSGFHQELAQKPLLTFERSARQFLNSADFQPPQTVIMEGFTRLTPLQETFIRRCLEAGNCHLIMLYPYRELQEEGFRALQATYVNMLASDPVRERSCWRTVRNPTALRQVSQELFRPSPNVIIPDSSVQLHAALNRTQEVEHALDIILSFREANPRADVALVTRDSEGYKPLLREAAARRGPEVENLFDLPPTHLLLSPVGRFIHHLYDSWDTNSSSLNLGAANFAEMLASGWLGKRARESSVLFRALIPAYFARCRRMDEWSNIFQGMRNTTVLGDLQEWATSSDIDLWSNRLQIVNKLVYDLFSADRASLSTQIARLEQALNTLEIDDIEEAEQAVIDGIMDVFHEFVASSDFEITAAEVREIITALGRELADVENHFRITITGPESIDSLKKHLIYYLGLDDVRVPRPPADEWPLIVPPTGLQQHYDFERYLFLATVRAADKELHLSYAEVDGQQACRASLYLEEVAALMKQSVPRANRQSHSAGQRPTLIYPQLSLKSRSEYPAEELALVEVCPRRAYLERLTKSARYYRNSWQSDLLVQGILFSLTTQLAERNWPDGLPENLHEAQIRLETLVQQQGSALFPGIHPSRWPFITKMVVSNLIGSARKYQAEQHIRPKVIFRRKDNIKGENIKVRGGHNGTLGHANSPKWLLNTDTLTKVWLLPPSSEDSRKNAFQWWEDTMKTLTFKGRTLNDIQIQPRVNKLTNTNGAPRPGSHCIYCPVVGLCLANHSGEQG